MASWSYTFSTTLTEPPTGNQIRFDAAFPYTAVAKVWIRNITIDGVDIHVGLMGIDPDSTLYLQDKNDHTLYATFTTTAAPVDKIDYVEVPVTHFAHGSALLNQASELVVTPPSDSPPVPPISGPMLVTLEVAKDHLHVTGTAEDARITRQIEDASDYIMRYLHIYGDAEWTPTTVPPVVRSAVLLKLTGLHDDLGDDMSREAARLDAIMQLLLTIRTPTVA